MENKKKTIGIDQQIEAVQDMLPVIDKASKEVFEEVIRSLQFAKESAEYVKQVIINALMGDDLSAEDLQKSYQSGNEYIENAPEWARQVIDTVIDDPEMKQRAIDLKISFDGAIAEKAGKQNNQAAENHLEKPEELNPEDYPEVQKYVKNGGRYIRKRNRFKSGVRRFYVEVMTEETYPNFKLVPYRNEAERDEDFLDLLTVEGTKEYPVPDKK